MRASLWAATTALLLIACEDEPLPAGRITLYPGKEGGMWATAPAVAKVDVVEVAPNGSRRDFTTLEAVPTPAAPGVFELPEAGIAQYEARGLDSEGKLQALGLSWYLDTSGVVGFNIPMFVGRVGSFGRLEAKLTTAQGTHPPVASLGGRFMLTGGARLSDSIALEGVDFGLWATSAVQNHTCPSTDCEVKSLAVANQSILLAVGNGWAIMNDYQLVDFPDASDPSLPNGLASWSDVAGGQSIPTAIGEAYLIGGTRTGTPTASVLRISGDGQLSALKLKTPRAGAAAVWVPGRGILVAGGSAEGAGAELLPDGASEFQSLGYPADATVGSALVAFDRSAVLRLGGSQGANNVGSVTYDLDCEKNCTPTPYPGNVPLAPVQAFDLEDGTVLAVGDGIDGFSKAYLLTADAEPKEIPLKEPRKGASAARSALGHVVVLGGSDSSGTDVSTVELFTPGCLGGCN